MRPAFDVAPIDLAHADGRRPYDDLFESCPGAFIQQSSWWADVVTAVAGDVPFFLVCRRDGIPIAGLPLYLFRHAKGNILTSVPLPGPMGGVFCRPDVPEADRDRAYASLLGAAVEIAGRHDCLTLTLITNPFDADLHRYERHLAPDYVLENFTQYVEVDTAVSGDRLALPAALRRTNLRRNLGRAEAAGFTVERCRSEADLLGWYAVHRDRHRELGAEPLALALLRRILEVLEPRGRAHLLLVKQGEDVASGAIYVYHRDVLDVYILSMSGRFAALGPSFLNTRESLLEAGRRGVRFYNWQSSPSRESGVYRYKEQWGSREAAYAFVTRRLCDPARLWQIGAEGARTHYRGHYLIPFAAFAERSAYGRYRK